MWHALGLDGAASVDVIASVVGIYAVFTVLIRLLGQRSVARLSAVDVPVVLVVGSVAGRVVTGYTPTLGAGAIALVTLFALHWAVHRLARTWLGARVVREVPVLLMAGEEFRTGSMARARVTEAELWGALRAAGVRNPGEVACVILESTGQLSVLKRGEPLDRRLLAEVQGAEALPERLFEGKR